MPRILATLLAPFLLLLLVEFAFESGAWERIARPGSHAGTSVRLKRALRDPAVARIDVVTLGSSRPEHGLDHAALAAVAGRHGQVHADLTMPGTHWMTVGVLMRWLAREHPEIRSGVLALSVQDFSAPGNGAYELGIVQPFRRLQDMPWIAAHVPFRLSDIATWGTASALAQWRTDVREYVADPFARAASIDWYAQYVPTRRTLFGNAESSGDMCAFGVDDLDACARVDASTADSAAGPKRQCRELRMMAAARSDYLAAMRDGPTAGMLETRRLIQSQLRESAWPEPPVVVLMPMPPVWNRAVLGEGMHAWALSILQPLVDEGRVRVLDATDVLDGPDACAAFFDFYHQNATGRARLHAWLEPRLEPLLYPRDAPAH